MTNEFLENLIKFARPGYNLPEQTWHFKRFQSQQGKIDALADLAKEVSAGQNIPLPDATKLILDAEKQDTEAMAQLGQWLERLGQISDEVNLERNVQERDLATMMLVSRLPLKWVLENREKLETEYCVDLPTDKADLEESDKAYKDAVDYSRLSKLKRAKWLDSKDLWKVMRAVTSMLPGSIIAEISDYALNEFRDGKQPELATPETAEERLGKPEPELPMPDEPSSD